jgi:hypothetical protein
MMATFDRTDALNRDDIQFFTPDHPLLRNSLDSLLSSEKGNAVLSVYQGTGSPRYFPASHLPGRMCGTPRFTHRSLPGHSPPPHFGSITPGEIISAPDLSAEHLNHSPDTDDILGNAGIKRLVKKMRKSAEAHMFQVTEDLVAEARISVEQELQSEISRPPKFGPTQPIS